MSVWFTWIIPWSVLVFSVGCSRPVEPDPAVLLWDGEALQALQRDHKSNGPRAGHPAWQSLMVRAAQALETPSPTVTANSSQASGGGQNDYFSVGRYYWPQADQPDGLPWMARDGVVNPLANSEEYDAALLVRFSREVVDLSLAYYVTGEEQYARGTVKKLQCWFVAPETRMNPHLRFAQAVPGVRDGSRFGIIEGMEFVPLIDGISLLATSDAYTPELDRGLRGWFGEYLRWLLESPAALEERYADNNHGTYMDCQLVTIAWWLGRNRLAGRTLKESIPMRVADHIAEDGSQPREMRRTRTFEYHTYNLRGLFLLARMGERYGVDLWHARDERLRRALDYLAPYADAEITWPHPEVAVERSRLIFLLRQGGRIYEEPRYEAMLQQHLQKFSATAMDDLLWPAEEGEE